MSRDPIKNYLKAMYPKSKNWAKQVDEMSREKAFAIYKRDQEAKEQKKLEEETENLAERYPQGKLF
jgi:hypothetical protein